MHGDDGASVVVDGPSIQRSVMQYEGGCGDIDSLHPPSYDISRYPSWGAIITCAVCDAATAAA
ncbi:hypothetical protein DXA79_06180 [Bifidobacterium pseudocatenulatum]|uniref:Uncharacterized protein n=1 Tax=Bifidobacterium pseudocatenulatum TaxID=28026 RepID=A0A3E5HLU7_BIFPS|nr:hypothetical protein DXA79_06180 [Bifidobacterium pseudocatenulatum]RGT68799.1 hypothetical protein DWX12_03785 [Bifidobacterium pseudocatenulatum]